MIGSRLREFRKAMGFTQKELAENLNTQVKYIADVETEKTMPGGQSLALLNKNFNININWLLTGKGEMLNRETPGDEYWIQKCISGKDFFKFRVQKRNSQINSLECAINKTRTDELQVILLKFDKLNTERALAIAELKDRAKGSEVLKDWLFCQAKTDDISVNILNALQKFCKYCYDTAEVEVSFRFGGSDDPVVPIFVNRDGYMSSKDYCFSSLICDLPEILLGMNDVSEAYSDAMDFIVDEIEDSPDAG